MGQLDKLKAALKDACAALQMGTLSEPLSKTARTVQKEVTALLKSDGVDVDTLDAGIEFFPTTGFARPSSQYIRGGVVHSGLDAVHGGTSSSGHLAFPLEARESRN